MSLKFRWALIAIWAFVAFDSMENGVFATFLIVGVAAGILVSHKLKTFENYRNGASRFAEKLRMVDVILVCLSTAIGPKSLALSWLIAVPIIIFDGIVSRDRKSVSRLVAIASAILLYGAFQSESIFAVTIPIVAIVFSAFVGLVLSQFQTKDKVLRDRDRRLTTLMNTASNLAASGDLRNLILGTLKAAVHDLGAHAGIVCLTSEEDRGLLITEAAYAVQGDFFFPVVLGIGEGVSGYVAKMGQPITLTAQGDEVLDCDGIGLPVKAAFSVPLVNREFSGTGVASSESIIGSMTLINSEYSEGLDSEELDLLQSLSSLLANAIHNARMEERSRATFLRTLESLATALEARDDYTRGHSQRVCDLSVMIGSKLGLMPDALEELRIGTILHDIGKIGVPDAILNKPGRLSNEEFQFMKSHPVIGYEICRPLMLSEGVLMIIRNHHEKLDGSGYPDGLKGGELPLSLRIVCVADAFDAMSSRRPYRGVMDMRHVMGELSKGAGVQFDPVVVEALKDLLYANELDDLYAEYWEPKKQSAIRKAA